MVRVTRSLKKLPVIMVVMALAVTTLLLPSTDAAEKYVGMGHVLVENHLQSDGNGHCTGTLNVTYRPQALDYPRMISGEIDYDTCRSRAIFRWPSPGAPGVPYAPAPIGDQPRYYYMIEDTRHLWQRHHEGTTGEPHNRMDVTYHFAAGACPEAVTPVAQPDDGWLGVAYEAEATWAHMDECYKKTAVGDFINATTSGIEWTIQGFLMKDGRSKCYPENHVREHHYGHCTTKEYPTNSEDVDSWGENVLDMDWVYTGELSEVPVPRPSWA